MSLLKLDQKLSEKQRKAVYGGGLIGAGGLIIAQVLGFIGPESIDSIVQLVSVVGGFLGLSAAGTAASVLKGQQTNGAVIGNVELPTVEVEIPPVPLTPVEKVTQAVQEVAELDAQVRGGVKQLQEITGGLINIPGVLAMTPDLPGPLDDLVRGAGERFKDRL